jgi:hypothetical protein
MRAGRIRIGTLAIALLVLAAACGSSGGSDSSKSSSSGSKSSDTSGDSSSGGGNSDLRDPCTLITQAKASEILGGKAAAPEGHTNDTGAPSRSCSWQTQDAKDNPSLDTAGHILTLTVFGPPSEAMTTEQFFESAKLGASSKGTVCEKSFYQGGILNGFQSDVFVSGSAGLNSTTPEAKKAVTDLVGSACETIG